MRRSVSLVCIVCLLSLTGCIDIIEEIFLEKNGSGKYRMTFDMKSMLAMKDLWLSQSPIGERKGFQFSKDKTDTVIHFTSMADSVRRKFQHPELVQRAVMHFTIDQEAGVMLMALEFPFRDIGEVNTLLEDLNSAGNGHEFGGFGFLSSYEVKKRSIDRKTLLESPGQKSDSLRAFLAIMMANARVKTVYHLPRKVKSTTIKDAYIRDNECMVEMTYAELIGRKKSMDGRIVFK